MVITFVLSVVLQGMLAGVLVSRIVHKKKSQCIYSVLFFVLVTSGMTPDNLVFFAEFDQQSLGFLVGVVALARFSTEALVEAGLETAFAFEQSLTGSSLLLVLTS